MSYLFVKKSEGVQEGLPMITAIEEHLSIMILLVLPEAGAVWEGLHELCPFAWTHPAVSGLVPEEARTVQQVHPFLPASTGPP